MQKGAFFGEARQDLPGPLSGVLVIEATTTWAGPMAGCILADFGARVIKIEHPTGEVARNIPPLWCQAHSCRYLMIPSTATKNP